MTVMRLRAAYAAFLLVNRIIKYLRDLKGQSPFIK
jgi:hypothetical protein